MKIEKFISGLIVFFVIVITGFLTLNKEIKKSLDKMKKCGDLFQYRSPYLSYFNDKHSFPENIEQLLSYIKDKPLYSSFKDCHIDPFSKDKKLMQYVPLYDSIGKIVSFLLISSGPDGKINNRLEDTYFESTFQNRMSFYNTNVEEMGITVYIDTIAINPLSFFFGKKDFLVSYISAKSFYEGQCDKLYDPIELIQQVLNKNLRERSNSNIKLTKTIFAFRLVNENINRESNEQISYSTQEDWKITCNLISPHYYSNQNRNKYIVVYGLLDDIDFNTKNIVFVNCFLDGE